MRELNTQIASNSMPVEPLHTSVLQATELTYRAGGTTLLDGVNLNIATHQITMIMGPNGAGKSLLLRLLHGLITASSGQILWHDQPISHARRAQQAMVFQRPVLLRRSVAANLDFALSLAPAGRQPRRSRDTLLEAAGLLGKANQPARSLSGGEQQRLALMRALALSPEVLFLDEPTASLDPVSTQFIERIVGEAHRDGTHVLFVTHDIGQAKRLADAVLFLHHGSVAEFSNAGSFFDRPASAAGRAYLEGRIVL